MVFHRDNFLYIHYSIQNSLDLLPFLTKQNTKKQKKTKQKTSKNKVITQPGSFVSVLRVETIGSYETPFTGKILFQICKEYFFESLFNYIIGAQCNLLHVLL